jgi:hypothetical protein
MPIMSTVLDVRQPNMAIGQNYITDGKKYAGGTSTAK